MKRNNLLNLVFCINLLFLFGTTLSIQAQVEIDASFTTGEMVDDFFNTTANCVTLSNVYYVGTAEQRAFFNATNSTLGIQNGILLSTGNAETAVEGSPSEGASTNLEGGGYDALETLVGTLSYDACILRFDLVPAIDTISFTYIFASEEYPEFVGTGYNDVFAFFVSGPGIEGTQNIATVPNTDLPVSVNTINVDTASQYYVDNSSQAVNVEFGGFTTPLEAKIAVVPFETYQVEIAIADVSDAEINSAVFIGIESLCGGDGIVIKADFAWEINEENNKTIHFQSNTNYSDCNVLWDFGDGAQSIGLHPTHTYAEAGVYQVSLTASKYGEEITVVRTVIVGNPVGIEENKSLSFNISPNPANDFITLSLNTQSQNQLTQIRFLDIQGQIHYQQNLISGASNTIDISDLEEGTYLIQVQTDEEVVTKKWMKF